VAARLLVISGPLRTSQFPLDAEVAIGRDVGNTIRLQDPAVSPHHCLISFLDGLLTLCDLDSHSGTFVNGIPAKQRVLKSGDEVAVGNSVFRLELEDSRATAKSPVETLESDVLNVKPEQLQAPEFVSLDAQSLAALPPAARRDRTFSALVQVCRAIGSLRDQESLPWVLLGLIFDVIPAERGAVLLWEKDSDEIVTQVSWDRLLGPQHPVNVSREIVRLVAEEGASLRNNGPSTEGHGIEEIARPVRAASEKPSPAFLCAPVVSGDKAIGLIYLESGNPTAPFTEDDFQLLSAIAGLAAVGIENARQFENLGSENQRLRAEVGLTHDMVGRSAPMCQVYQFIERVSPTDSTVLIHGESGTGKELVAVAIHKNSSRKDQPFVALNCAALAESLLESELFGHEKGAFTSAVNQKKGFLEVAEGGTIFLDEIGELSLILQAKLLRVLQEREFVRVGGTRPIKINVRFLAATNKDLQKCSREGTFRADLFHRLNVISIALPSLREHSADIPALAEHFTARHAKNCNRNVTGISDEAMACLTQYDWPGNIRELENALERAVVIGSSDRLLAEDLPETLLESAKSGPPSPARYHAAIRNLKKQLIVGALDQSAGNITEAAKLLGVHANYLHRLMRNLELRPPIRKQTSA
jgi:transcriptional regulator with GAF, ATPase, and Fis domain